MEKPVKKPAPKVRMRTKVTNGLVLKSMDGRTRLAKRYDDILSAVLSDMGGATEIAETKLQLAKRFCASAAIAEALEAKLADGEEINLADHVALSSVMVRIGPRIGLSRVARDAMTLPQYLESLQREKAEPVEIEGQASS